MHKENQNTGNKTCRVYVDDKSLIRVENHSTTYQRKTPVFKLNTLNNATGVNSIKSQLMKYRKVKLESVKGEVSKLRDGQDSARMGTAYTNALLKFKNLKQAPNTFR